MAGSRNTIIKAPTRVHQRSSGTPHLARRPAVRSANQPAPAVRSAGKGGAAMRQAATAATPNISRFSSIAV
ncbi:hypothetical protein, partial [Paucibacter sp. XJ19-41]|uniref:hypothetical protein n=1 Tax=Paucibacter sp. XJ19-41 TaxID=2927824 RepID=UPI00234BB41A